MSITNSLVYTHVHANITIIDVFGAYKENVASVCLLLMFLPSGFLQLSLFLSYICSRRYQWNAAYVCLSESDGIFIPPVFSAASTASATCPWSVQFDPWDFQTSSNALIQKLGFLFSVLITGLWGLRQHTGQTRDKPGPIYHCGYALQFLLCLLWPCFWALCCHVL